MGHLVTGLWVSTGFHLFSVRVISGGNISQGVVSLIQFSNSHLHCTCVVSQQNQEVLCCPNDWAVCMVHWYSCILWVYMVGGVGTWLCMTPLL